MNRSVLYITDSLGLSGKTRTLAYLATHLDSQRFKSSVCTLDPERTVLTEQLEACGVAVHALPCSDGINIGMVPRLARLMHRVKADVVHCYNPRPILYGGLAAKCVRVGGTIGSLSAFACLVPDRAYAFLPQPLTTVSRRNVYRNRAASHLMRYLVAVSATLGQRFCEYNAVPSQKLRVVPYGADLSGVWQVTPGEASALRRELGFEPDDILVGSIGRLVEQKDYPTQLNAFATAAAAVPALRMVMAGAGPLEPMLRGMVEQLGVADRVRFLGHWERVPTLLRALDIFVIASKFEPFGVALLEAKAAGLPIVATRVNEIPEIISDRDTGLLCPPGDPEAMATLLIELATNAAQREALGRRALAEARSRHSLDAVVDAYQNLYDSALN